MSFPSCEVVQLKSKGGGQSAAINPNANQMESAIIGVLVGARISPSLRNTFWRTFGTPLRAFTLRIPGAATASQVSEKTMNELAA